VPVYLVGAGGYFSGDDVYTDVTNDIERFSCFCRAAMRLGREAGFEPDVIQCHDWHTSFIPILSEVERDAGGYDGGQSYKTLQVVHSMQYQGICSRFDMFDRLDLPTEFFSPASLEFYGQANSLKGGLLFATRLATVSRNYAMEIQHAYYGENLEGIVRARAGDLTGVMCGIDLDEYDPERDPCLARRYGPGDAAEGKRENKEALRRALGLEEKPGTPLVAVVADILDRDKGVDLIRHVMGDILSRDVQLVFACKRQGGYGDYFRSLAAERAGQVAYVGVSVVEGAGAGENGASGCTGKQGGGARGAAPGGGGQGAGGAAGCGCKAVPETLLLAGSDLLLRPSRVEPCGEKHLIAMRYGTVPLVRETGGLKDVVASLNDDTGEGNGFSFFNYNAHDMLYTLDRALGVYRDDPGTWRRLVGRGMATRLTWDDTARGYGEIYARMAG